MRVSKQPGEKWLVTLRQGGGDLTIDEKDDAVFDSEEGLIVYHNDRGRTVTFAPKEGIGWIRAYHPQGDGGFSKMRAQDPLGRAEGVRSHPPITAAARAIEQAQEAKDRGEESYPVPVPCLTCRHIAQVHREQIGACRICACPEFDVGE